MSTWQYLIPRFRGSKWDKQDRFGVVYSVDLEVPRVGIYCGDGHAGDPWLVGSFTISDAVDEGHGSTYWGWSREYATGDGRLIRLGRRSRDTGFQQIVDDVPHDPDAFATSAEELSRELTRAFEDGADTQQVFDRMSMLNEQHDRDREQLRLRAELSCGACGQRRVFRDDTVQRPVGLLWKNGIREIDLVRFAESVSRGNA